VRNSARSILVVVALAASAFAAPRGIHPVAASRTDRALTAASPWGQTYVAEREVHVDLDFPSGKTGMGTFFLWFEPSTGFLVQTSLWVEHEYPKRWWTDNPKNSDLVAHLLVGVTTDRLVVAGAARGNIEILDSAEKAASMDDTEAKTLQWASDHLAELEVKRGSHRPLVTELELSRWEFPEGFFDSWFDSFGIVPIALVGLAPRDDSWELTFESTETQRRATLLVTQRKNGWTRGPIQVEQHSEKKR